MFHTHFQICKVSSFCVESLSHPYVEFFKEETTLFQSKIKRENDFLEKCHIEDFIYTVNCPMVEWNLF